MMRARTNPPRASHARAERGRIDWSFPSAHLTDDMIAALVGKTTNVTNDGARHEATIDSARRDGDRVHVTMTLPQNAVDALYPAQDGAYSTERARPMVSTHQIVVEILSHAYFAGSNLVLRARLLAVLREAYGDLPDTTLPVDFLVGRTAIAVAVEGPTPRLYNRLTKAGQSRDVDAVVVVTIPKNKRAMPATAGGAPLYVVPIRGAA